MMRAMQGNARSRVRVAAIAISAALVVGSVAGAALAADPTPTPFVPPGQADKSAKPDKAANPGQAKKGEKAAKTPEVDVTVEGTVQQGTDGQGRPTFTLTAAGTTWELSAGPPWYWGDNNPLKAFVGKSVKIAGLDKPTALAFAPDGTLYITVVGPKGDDENAPKQGQLLKIAPGL